MTLKGETVTKINAEYMRTLSSKKMQLNVGFDDNWSDSVYTNNWKVCKIEELSAMIKELTELKETIENTIGVVL